MTTGKIKTLIVLIVLILAVLFPLGGVQSKQITLLSVGVAFIWGVIFPQFPYFNTLFKRISFKTPRWKEKFDLKHPLTYIQFFAFFILAAGIGFLTGGMLKGQFFNFIGILLLSLGSSIIIGIYLIPNTLNNKMYR